VVSNEELALLQRFDADGRLALSLYLDVSTPERRATVMQRIRDQLRTAAWNSQPGDEDLLTALGEDLEMVRLYFRTTAGRRSRYVAIFVCAPQLFWRVYPLDGPISEEVYVGRHFEVGPLVRAQREVAAAREIALEPDLLLYH
jgi:hypothetical protein